MIQEIDIDNIVGEEIGHLRVISLKGGDFSKRSFICPLKSNQSLLGWSNVYLMMMDQYVRLQQCPNNQNVRILMYGLINLEVENLCQYEFDICDTLYRGWRNCSLLIAIFFLINILGLYYMNCMVLHELQLQLY